MGQQVFGKLTMFSNSFRTHLFRKKTPHILLRMTSKYINVEGKSRECVRQVTASGFGLVISACTRGNSPAEVCSQDVLGLFVTLKYCSAWPE